MASALSSWQEQVQTSVDLKQVMCSPWGVTTFLERHCQELQIFVTVQKLCVSPTPPMEPSPTGEVTPSS